MVLLKLGVVVGIAYFGDYCSKLLLKVGVVEAPIPKCNTSI
jgi:Na+/H+ antiporter NhaC